MSYPSGRLAVPGSHECFPCRCLLSPVFTAVQVVPGRKPSFRSAMSWSSDETGSTNALNVDVRYWGGGRLLRRKFSKPNSGGCSGRLGTDVESIPTLRAFKEFSCNTQQPWLIIYTALFMHADARYQWTFDKTLATEIGEQVKSTIRKGLHRVSDISATKSIRRKLHHWNRFRKNSTRSAPGTFRSDCVMRRWPCLPNVGEGEGRFRSCATRGKAVARSS